MSTGELVIGSLMVIATFVLVGATIMLAIVTSKLSKSAKQQTRFIKRQTEILSVSEERSQDRDMPKLLLRQTGHTIGYSTSDGSMIKHFEGFTVTNAGAVDVTVAAVGATFAIPSNDPSTASLRSINLAPKEWHGFALRGDDLPVKLRTGDFATYMFDCDELEEIGLPFQWRCEDSLGSTHNIDGWYTHSGDTLTILDIEGKYAPPTPSSGQLWIRSR